MLGEEDGKGNRGRRKKVGSIPEPDIYSRDGIETRTKVGVTPGQRFFTDGRGFLG